MQRNYSQRFAVSTPGALDGIGQFRAETFKNSALDGKNLWTIGIPATVDNSTTYSLSVTGGGISGTETVSYTTDGSATQAELRAGLLAAAKASSVLPRYFGISSSGNNLLLEALQANIAYTVTSPTNASTTNDLTLTETTAAAASAEIPFGRFVVRKTTAPADAHDEARLPTTATGVILAGVTMLTHAIERVGMGTASRVAYQPNEAMDVLTNNAATRGIYVKCDGAGINPEATVYIDTQSASNRGGLTLTSTSNLALPATCKVREPATQDPNGDWIVLVGVNLP